MSPGSGDVGILKPVEAVLLSIMKQEDGAFGRCDRSSVGFAQESHHSSDVFIGSLRLIVGVLVVFGESGDSCVGVTSKGFSAVIGSSVGIGDACGLDFVGDQGSKS